MQNNYIHTASFTDVSAWKALKHGDQCAFEYLYQKYVDLLYDYGCRITCEQELVADCIHELFADIWQKRLQFDEIKSTKYYLLVALKRRIIRAITSRKEFNFSTDYFFDAILYSDQQPHDRQISEEKIQVLKDAFTKLSSKQKEAVYLRFYNQLSIEEIADIMEIQVKAVYKLLYRAFDTLRKHIPIKASYLWTMMF